MKSFKESSYLAQVRRLHNMANLVVKKFPLQNYKLRFIHHGENTTFKVTTAKNNYLLRLHRNGYHTKSAILEELRWLKDLSNNTEIPVQRPLLSKAGHLVELQSAENAPARYCSLLAWQPGRMRFQNLNPINFFRVGELTAQLHKSATKVKIKHRNYWGADGLLGENAKLGSLVDLKGVISANDYSDMIKCRNMVYSKISSYQKTYPKKLSLIHADLHFGNMLWQRNNILPIDFDDCGVGFQLMDLAVTLISSEKIFKKHGLKKLKSNTEALLNGYCSIGNLTKEDLEHLPYFILTRKLAIVAWLNERRDNPRLLNYFKTTLKGNISEFRKAMASGPKPLF